MSRAWDRRGGEDDDDEEPERWIPQMGGGATRDRGPEQWAPAGPAGANAPDAGGAAGPGQRPEDVFRQFFEMRHIPEDAEVVVAPSMRAAVDVPLKVLIVIVILFGPFTATGFFVQQPAFENHEPLAWLYAVYAYWPLLIFVVYPALRLRFTRYIVDAEGIRTRTQMLAVSEERISWNKVTAIQYRRTLFDRLLGLERLSIIAYGQRGATIRLIGLRDAKDLRNLTAQKMREHATAEAIFSND